MKKMDEMELYISNNAVKWAWAFDVIVLLAWSIWDRVRTGHFTAPAYLLVSQNLLYLIAVQIGKWRAGDEDGKKGFLWQLAALVFFLLLGVILLWIAGRSGR